MAASKGERMSNDAPIIGYIDEVSVNGEKRSGRLIGYGEGHRLEPNDVGDYRLVCPKGADTPMIPFMFRSLLGGRQCPCGYTLKDQPE
jgi:hypothetical protein